MIFGIMTSSLLFVLSGGRFTFLKVSVLGQKVQYLHFFRTYFGGLLRIFGVLKNVQEIAWSENYFFRAFFGFLVSPTGIGGRFWSQNGAPGGIIEGFLKQELVFEVLTQLFDDLLEKIHKFKT